MVSSSALPWRKDNEFKLLIDGEEFFSRMLSSINEARDYIFMEMYLFESGALAHSFIEAFASAAKRGVNVCLLLDDFGSMGMSLSDRQRLILSGVFLAFYNPIKFWKWRTNLHRNHRKLLIVDGDLAFTGGAGISDFFWRINNDGKNWRETMIEVRGGVLEDWQKSFENNWSFWSIEVLPPLPQFVSRETFKMSGRVALAGFRDRYEIIRTAVKRIRGAKTRVWISTAYFIPTWKIRRALRSAAGAGIDVRILVPGPVNDHPSIRHIGRQYYHRLLKNGVRIFEYRSRFIHSKVMICDDWVSIGSSNLDRWEMRWNIDANQEVEDSSFSEQTMKMFLEDFKSCAEIELSEWLARPWKDRILEKFWGAILTWAEYFVRIKKPFSLKSWDRAADSQ